jgi:hypothetical protein
MNNTATPNENKIGNVRFNLYNEKEQGVNSSDLAYHGYKMVGYYSFLTDGGRKIVYGETWERAL